KRTVNLMHQWVAITRADAEKLANMKASKFLPLGKLYEASIERPTQESFKQANTLLLTNLEKLQEQYQKEKKEKGAYLNTLRFYHSLVNDRLKKNVLEIPSL